MAKSGTIERSNGKPKPQDPTASRFATVDPANPTLDDFAFLVRWQLENEVKTACFKNFRRENRVRVSLGDLSFEAGNVWDASRLCDERLIRRRLNQGALRVSR